MKAMLLVYLSFGILIFVGLFGWVMNIIEIVQSTQIDGMVIVRIAGIFLAPLGAVLGYL